MNGTVRVVVSAIAVAGITGCAGSDSLMPHATPAGTPSFATIATAGAQYTYILPGSPTTYSVTGAFHDVIHFTVPAPATYQISVVGNTRIIACSGRYCMSPGTQKASVTNAQLQTTLGVTLSPIVGTTSIALSAGSYALVVDGIGQGTKKYLNQGTYTVTIRAPVSYVPSCDYVRGILQTQGYTDAQIEAMVDAMAAATPPKCIGD